MAQKRQNLAQYWHFRSFWANYQHFWPILSHALPKYNANKVPRWFSVMWVPKHLLSPVKIRIFCPKTTKFCPKLAYLVVLSHHLVPCWWAGWWLWHTGCISQDTYLLYHLSNSSHMKCSLNFRYRLLGVWLPVYKISFSFLIAFLCYL